MTPFEQIILQVGLSLIVAVTTAWLTVWLSLRRFYREKWWEAKMRAYSDVIQSIHHMNRDVEISLRAISRGRDNETEYDREWAAKHRAAWEEIRKQIDIGEFLYSSESIRILRALNDESESSREGDYLDHLLKIQDAVVKYLPELKVAARSDLGLPAIKKSKGVR